MTFLPVELPLADARVLHAALGAHPGAVGDVDLHTAFVELDAAVTADADPAQLTLAGASELQAALAFGATGEPPDDARTAGGFAAAQAQLSQALFEHCADLL